jgi:hypothetical protein
MLQYSIALDVGQHPCICASHKHIVSPNINITSLVDAAYFCSLEHGVKRFILIRVHIISQLFQ